MVLLLPAAVGENVQLIVRQRFEASKNLPTPSFGRADGAGLQKILFKNLTPGDGPVSQLEIQFGDLGGVLVVKPAGCER